MLDSLRRKSFRASKCKTLLKLTVARIKLLRNKVGAIAKQARRDVAQLLKSGQEASARNRVEIVYREESILAAYDLIQQYCDLISNRLPIINAQKLCPPDLKEAISSLIYAAPRSADLHELQKVRHMFELKYGRDFVISATELRPDCGVSRQIIEKLSARPPAGKVKLMLMKEIAADNEIEWEPKEAMDEIMKPPADVLDGPDRLPHASQVSKSGIEGNNRVSEPGKAFSAKQVHPSPGPTIPTISSPSSEENAMEKLQFSVNHDTNTKDSAEHVGPGRQDKAIHHLLSEQKPNADSYAIAKAEGKMDYGNSYYPYVRAEPNRKSGLRGTATRAGNVFPRSEKEKNMSSADQSLEIESPSTGSSNLHFEDVATAAQVAYESATQAAAAARMVIDLAKHDPKNSPINRMASEIDSSNKKLQNNVNTFNRKNATQVLTSHVNLRRENELDSIGVRHTKKIVEVAGECSSSDSEWDSPSPKIFSQVSGSDARSLKVENSGRPAQFTPVRPSHENSDSFDRFNVGNTVNNVQHTRSALELVNDDSLETSSEDEYEARNVWPSMKGARPEHSSSKSTRSPVMRFYEGNDTLSMPVWDDKSTSSTFNLHGENSRRPSDLSILTGPKFDNIESENDDDNRADLITKPHAAKERFSKPEQNHSSFSRLEDWGSSPLEDSVDSEYHQGYGQRWRAGLSANVEKDVQTHARRAEPHDLPEKRVHIESYDHPDNIIAHGSGVSKVVEAGYKGTAFTLDKQEPPANRKLRWQSRFSEEEGSYMTSDDLKPRESSGFINSVARHEDNEVENDVMQRGRKGEEEDDDVASQVKSNTYSGRSRRSVRSVR